MPDLQRIDFHGDQISTCKDETTGKVYCLPREITERLGASWSSQRTKLANSALFSPHTSRADINTPGGMQELLLLDIDYLPAWLGSISASKVNELVRTKLVQYQEECAQVLRDYWTKGAAFNPRSFVTPSPDPSAHLALIDQCYALLSKLGQLTARDALMLADQARNVMQSGQRLLPSAAPAHPAQTIYGFSVAERVEQLGYQLSRKQQAALAPQLGKRVIEEWRSRYPSEPEKETRWVDGAQRQVAWYPHEDALWIDAIIQGYLAQFPGITQTHSLI